MTLEGICLHCRTKIQTPDGDVNIEDIQAGDQVYACNVDTGEVGVKEVKQTFVREVNILVHTFVGEEEIITTTNHPFYVVGRGFVKAEDLRIGYTLLQLDGSTEKISRIVVRYSRYSYNGTVHLRTGHCCNYQDLVLSHQVVQY